MLGTQSLLAMLLSATIVIAAPTANDMSTSTISPPGDQQSGGEMHGHGGGDSRHFFMIIDSGVKTLMKVFNYTVNESSYLGFSSLMTGAKKFKYSSLLDLDLNDPYNATERMAVKQFLQPLMDFARMYVSQSEAALTDIVYCAYGDYWVAPEDKVSATMQHVRRLLEHDLDFNPFMYSGPASVLVMSGEEQASMAWVTINYIKGFFDHPQSPLNSHGVMGLNKRSAYISFYTEDPIIENEFIVTVAKTEYKLYATSHMGYGTADILSHVVYKGEEMGVAIPTNPCLVDGEVWPMANGQSINITGTGDPIACIDLIRSVLAVRGCENRTCSIDNHYQPKLPQDMEFHAAKDFAASAVGDEKHQDHEHYLNNVEVLASGVSECHNKTHHHISPLSSIQCLLSMYGPLLMSAFGDPDRTNRVRAASHINGEYIGASLGMTVIMVYDKLHGIHNAQNPAISEAHEYVGNNTDDFDSYSEHDREHQDNATLSAESGMENATGSDASEEDGDDYDGGFGSEEDGDDYGNDYDNEDEDMYNYDYNSGNFSEDAFNGGNSSYALEDKDEDESDSSYASDEDGDDIDYGNNYENEDEDMYNGDYNSDNFGDGETSNDDSDSDEDDGDYDSVGDDDGNDSVGDDDGNDYVGDDDGIDSVGDDDGDYDSVGDDDGNDSVGDDDGIDSDEDDYDYDGAWYDDVPQPAM